MTRDPSLPHDPESASPVGVSRQTLLRRAIALSAISVAWNGLAGGAAIALAFASGSLSLLGFGVDAAIDSVASIVLIWRFRVEGTDPVRAAQVERVAERAVGGVLLLAAIALALGAARSLLAHVAIDPSIGSILLLAGSIVALPPLSRAKRRVAAQLGSRALRADAFLTAAAAVLAGVSLAGVLATTTLGLWWADAVGALVIAVVLAREGWGSFGLASGADSI